MGQSFSGENDGQSTVRTKNPKGREAEYIDFFTHRLGPLIVLFLWFVLSDLDKAVFYALSPEECADLAPPLARTLAKAKVPSIVHSAILNSADLTAVGMVAVGYLDRIGVLEKIIPALLSGGSKYGKQSSRNAQEVPSEVGEQPIDLASVRGLGAQYRSE